MLYATVEGEKTAAAPNLRGQCPGCLAAVIPKCGEIKRWHFAHVASAECDPWHEGETEWHLEWKSLFPKANVEVKVGSHRADVHLDRFVIEFQHSPISPEQIRERQIAYKRVLWVFDASVRNIELRPRLIRKEVIETGYDKALAWAEENGLDNPDAYADRVGDDWGDTYEPIYEEETVSPYRTFRWKWPQRSLAAVELSSHRLFFDCAEKGLFHVKGIHWDQIVGGWGHLYSRQEFLRRVLEPAGKAPVLAEVVRS